MHYAIECFAEYGEYCTVMIQPSICKKLKLIDILYIFLRNRTADFQKTISICTWFTKILKFYSFYGSFKSVSKTNRSKGVIFGA
jgi:hypothetical protein